MRKPKIKLPETLVRKREKEVKAKLAELEPIPLQLAEGELVTDEFSRAAFMRAMSKWMGLWMIGAGLYLLRLWWILVSDLTGGALWAWTIISFGAVWFLLYCARLVRAVMMWLRVLELQDAQVKDRHTIAQRTHDLEQREKLLLRKQAALEDLEAALHKEQVSKAVQERREAAEQRARQTAELAEIARELESKPDPPVDRPNPTRRVVEDQELPDSGSAR